MRRVSGRQRLEKGIRKTEVKKGVRETEVREGSQGDRG